MNLHIITVSSKNDFDAVYLMRKMAYDYRTGNVFLPSKGTLFITVGSLVLMIAAALILALGFTVIEDYSEESVFKKTNCIVRAVELNNMNPKNEWTRCPWRCTLQHTLDGLKTYCEISEFPCLKIVVDVMTKHGLKSAILHENPEKMQKYSECSTSYCDRDSVVNDKNVQKFKRTWGNIGKSYSCYYNMDSLSQEDDYDDESQEHALLKLSYHKASYINSIFWPCFVALAGIILVIYGLVLKVQQSTKQNNSKRNINQNI